MPPSKRLRGHDCLGTQNRERQIELCQRHMGLMKYCPSCYRNLMTALGALIPSVGQPVCVAAVASRTDISRFPEQASQIFPALCLGRVLLHKCPQWKSLDLCHDPFSSFPASWLYDISPYVPYLGAFFG